jgi:hypothetical protein
MAGFDPYRKWLGIPPQEQPPNHYRLLGIGLFESDPDVIAGAADRQIYHVRNFQMGEFAEIAQFILNELVTAQVCLLDPQRKAEYDNWLRQTMPVERPQPRVAPAPPASVSQGPSRAPSGSRAAAPASAPWAGSGATPRPVARAVAAPPQEAFPSGGFDVTASVTTSHVGHAHRHKKKADNTMIVGVAFGLLTLCLVMVIYFAAEYLSSSGSTGDGEGQTLVGPAAPVVRIERKAPAAKPSSEPKSDVKKRTENVASPARARVVEQRRPSRPVENPPDINRNSNNDDIAPTPLDQPAPAASAPDLPHGSLPDANNPNAEGSEQRALDKSVRGGENQWGN